MTTLSQRINGSASPVVAPAIQLVKTIVAPECTFDDKGKLTLPDLPSPNDKLAQAAWFTPVFTLNPANPVTRGEWQGERGPEGTIVLHRATAPDIRIEPARSATQPMQLIQQFSGRRHPGDGMLHAFKAEHCRQINYVLECFCDKSQADSEEQQAAAVVGTFLQGAVAVEGLTTYGTSQQRYEAACGLRTEYEPRYLIDVNSGEFVISVGDLAQAARRHMGSSLARNWLNGRMANLGWQRIRLDGHAEAGRAGRSGGPHARIDAYRGHLPAVDARDEAVTTGAAVTT